MSHNKKKNKSDLPKPLNFDHDKGSGDYLKKPYLTPEDERGDTKETQYHQEEEALSPEETKLRKEEDGM